MTMPTRSFFAFSMKARSGMMQIDAGQVLAGEGDAESTISHLRPRGGPKP